MNIKHWTLFIIGALLLSGITGAAIAQESDTPGEAVTGYYNWYLGYLTGSDEFRNPLVDGAYRDSEYLTEDFIERIDERLADAGDMGLGYDLFLCAQDVSQRYTYEVIRVRSGEALVLLRQYFGFNPRSHNLTLTLNNSEGAWKIDDVICGDTLTPRGVAQEFYNWYLGQWRQVRESEEGGNVLIDGTYQEYPFFTAELLASVDEGVANRELGWGDPFLCAQDIPQSSWIHDVSREGSAATVLVQTFFQGNPAPHNLTVNLALVDNQWRIAEIICGAGPQTMAQLLYRQYADQVRYNMDHGIEMDALSSLRPHWDRNVSPELLERLQAATEGELIADPVLCAQDIPERILTEVVDSSDTSATVRISGEYPSGPDTYTGYPLALVTMELVEGQWMLTDITCSH
jgi:hypothetical protein